HRPRAAQQAPLFFFGHKTQESDRVSQSKLGGNPFEASAVVALPADIERNVVAYLTRRGHSPQGKLHSFITLQSAQVQERGACGARRARIGTVAVSIDPRMDDDDPL